MESLELDIERELIFWSTCVWGDGVGINLYVGVWVKNLVEKYRGIIK